MVTLWRMCGRLPNSRQLLLVSCLLFMAWSFAFYHVAMVTSSRGGQKESEYLKAEIIRLSESYVRALAKENAGVVDGPYAGRFTAYDLKKTMAVLLENMLLRINELEHKVNNVLNVSTNASMNSNISNLHTYSDNLQPRNQLLAEDLIKGKVEACDLTAQDHQLYPYCKGKIEWMKQMWKSDPCYASYGVDGSICSFVMYLSEVEGWCPRKAWHGMVSLPKEDTSTFTYANATTDLEKLMKMLVDPNERQGYAWMRMRIRRLWDRWSKAITRLTQNQDLRGRKKKKILVHLGLLSRQSGWKFAENQFKGGPLGELVQWSDLISTLYILGHEIIITSETEQLARLLSPETQKQQRFPRMGDTCQMNRVSVKFDIIYTDIKGYAQMKKKRYAYERILAQLPAANSPCQSRKELPVQIIYTDIVGLRQFKKHVKGGYGKFSCLLRIVDSFGTEPAYNNRVYAKKHKILTSWGGQDLQPQQFFTMFPHSPDNSFMGFVVEQHLNDTRTKNIERKNQAVVYGKNLYMWEGKIKYLDVIKEFLEIHATVYLDTKIKPNVTLPKYAINHGLLNGEDLHILLRQSKLFIGLGFPYEGPAPLEAIANGAVFINPKFIPPHNSKNTKFFKGKPTLRDISSQQPYAAQFIGEPYVYTININDLEQVKQTVKKILDKNTFMPYMPYEFTEEGILQRMNAYIEHQNFCQFLKQPAKWPPSSAMSYIYGDAGVSCKDVCWNKSLICEPSHFREVNSATVLKKKGAECTGTKGATDIYFPALDLESKDCITQNEEMLYSCVGAKNNLRRLCPCRNFIKGQTALCQGCER